MIWVKFFLIFEAQEQTQPNKPLAALKSSSLAEGRQEEFHLHTTGFELLNHWVSKTQEDLSEVPGIGYTCEPLEHLQGCSVCDSRE
jgi:hypothetical protein